MQISSDSSFFTQHIQTAYKRTETLSRSIQALPSQQSQLLIDCLEEFQVLLAELEIAQEELQQQNEELISAQSLLEAEHQRYRDLFEFAPDGYLVTDVYGVVREANRAASQLLRRSQEHLMGKPLISFVPEENRRSFRTILNDLPTLNRIQEWEVQLKGRGNARFEAAITVETMRNDVGKVIALRWLIRNITERKQAEAQMNQIKLQNSELIELDRLRAQFFATMSHELRTPLNAILGFSDILLRQFRTQGQAWQIHMLERVLANGQHLLMLIEDVLDFSRLRSHRLQLCLQPLNLSELLTAITLDLQPLADRKNLELHIDLPSISAPIVNDPLRLRQVVMNLLSNAIKFTEVGSISVSVLPLPENRLAIVVQDTGIGISDVDQDQIFQEFWQVNQTRTRTQGGTGLGLAITKSLVELMQGSISLESQIGVGSVFRVEIPRQVFQTESN